MRLPTVKIQAENEQGFIIINERDLKDSHSLFNDKKPSQKAKDDTDDKSTNTKISTTTKKAVKKTTAK